MGKRGQASGCFSKPLRDMGATLVYYPERGIPNDRGPESERAAYQQLKAAKKKRAEERRAQNATLQMKKHPKKKKGKK